MNLQFKVKDSKEYYTITKSDHFGFTLTHHKPAKEGSKKEFSQFSLFYASLDQIAEKLVWIELEGNNLEEITKQLTLTATTIANTLKEIR